MSCHPAGRIHLLLAPDISSAVVSTAARHCGLLSHLIERNRHFWGSSSSGSRCLKSQMNPRSAFQEDFILEQLEEH